jgi:hypothetical protein
MLFGQQALFNSCHYCQKMALIMATRRYIHWITMRLRFQGSFLEILQFRNCWVSEKKLFMLNQSSFSSRHVNVLATLKVLALKC